MASMAYQIIAPAAYRWRAASDTKGSVEVDTLYESARVESMANQPRTALTTRRVHPLLVVSSATPKWVGWWGYWDRSRLMNSPDPMDYNKPVSKITATVYNKTRSTVLEEWLFWWVRRDR